MSRANNQLSIAAALRRRLAALTVAAAGVTACFAPAASADIVNLTSGNSSVSINTGSQAGHYSWIVDGVEHLKKEWFWYRVGSLAEKSVDTLDQTFIGTLGTDTLTVEYTEPAAQGARFSISITFTLTGGGPGDGVSDLLEEIRITNLTNAPLNDFHFFQYVDFDLFADAFDSSVVISGSPVNTVTQTHGLLALQETVTATNPTRYEAGVYNATLAKLNDANPDTFNNNPAAFNNDLTWGFEWQFDLPADGIYSITKDKHLTVIPEPTTLITLALGAVGLLRRRMKK